MTPMLETLTTLMLVATTIFSYLHAEYATAVICAMCAGFVGGMTIAKQIVQSRDRE